MTSRATMCVCVALLLGCAVNGADAGAPQADRQERIVGGPCEGCELVFDGMPDAPKARSRIAPPDYAGPPMTIEGVVRDAQGQPAAGVIVYAYHTDTGGIYPRPAGTTGRAEQRHGRLRGWAMTDAAGRYRFETIRPGGYPNTAVPAHVHMHVIEPGRCTYFIDDILFEDDPRLTGTMRDRMVTGRGGAGLVRPERNAGGAWVARRDIVLGEGIADYAACASPR